MKRICLVVFLCLFVFTGQAMAYMVGQFGTGGNISLYQPSAEFSGELFLHTGEPFVSGVADFDFNADYTFRYDWETVDNDSNLGAFNSGSVFWTGTLQSFIGVQANHPLQYDGTLVVGGNEIPFSSTYGENGDGHVFVGDFDFVGQIDPVDLSVSEIHVVPIPGALVLLGSGLLGAAGIRFRSKIALR